MTDLAFRWALPASTPLLPVVALQGRRVRRTTPRLPQVGGPSTGIAAGARPPLRVLVLGESTAAGVGSETHEEGLAGQFARAVAARAGRAVRWRAVGRVGATARCARERLVPGLPAEPVDLLVVALGINDVLRQRAPRAWAADLERLVDAVRERVGPVPVVLAGVPPAGRFPALPQPLRALLGLRAAALDREAARLARRLPGVVHVPAELPAGEHFFAADRFHPSPAGYRVWAEALAEPVEVGGTSA